MLDLSRPNPVEQDSRENLVWNQKEAYATVVTTVPAIFLTLVEGDNYASPLVGRNLAGSPDVI